ncbi:MAG: hypothetical protein AAF434_03860 [Pseudomonadota bacterium]
MFNLDRFLEECVAARNESNAQPAMREVVQSAVSDVASLRRVLGEPTGAGFETLYHSEDLTILNFTWAPLMTLMPHNHNMWAVIGLYSGREDNIFWRNRDDRIEAAGAKSMSVGDVATLGSDIVHSVTNPIGKLTSAIHVYGGDFFAPGRSEWDPETLVEKPFDIEKSRRIFKEANERFSLTQE